MENIIVYAIVVTFYILASLLLYILGVPLKILGLIGIGVLAWLIVTKEYYKI